MLEPKTKFSIIVFLKYLVFDPWTEKVRINSRTVIWIIIILAILLKQALILLGAIIVGVILHGVKEYKAGKHIHWYRTRKFGEREEVLKRIRKEKKSKPQTPNPKPKPFYSLFC